MSVTETMNGQSNIDGYDRSELNVEDQHATAKDQQGFIEDFDGNEVYGDDEKNRSGSSSYTGHQNKYLGQGDWVDKQYGEYQFDHKGDVEFLKPRSQGCTRYHSTPSCDGTLKQIIYIYAH